MIISNHSVCSLYSTLLEEEEEVDNMETHGGATLPTRKRFLRKSVLSDWGINYEELVIGKKIGDGRTGQVGCGGPPHVISQIEKPICGAY